LPGNCFNGFLLHYCLTLFPNVCPVLNISIKDTFLHFVVRVRGWGGGYLRQTSIF
jgi:hypothetical protein